MQNATTYEWAHSMAEVVTVLLDQGLVLEHLHEFPFCVYQRFPVLEQGDDGWWHWPSGCEQLPLTFSLKARSLEARH